MDKGCFCIMDCVSLNVYDRLPVRIVLCMAASASPTPVNSLIHSRLFTGFISFLQ